MNVNDFLISFLKLEESLNDKKKYDLKNDLKIMMWQ